MAESSPLLPEDPHHQAGGGQPAFEDRTITEINASVMPYLEKIFNSHTHTDKIWRRDQIISFISHRQADEVTEALGNIATKEELDLSGFLQYMTSSAANALAPPVDSDFSWPLSSYYISSSHNTYLTGNQLSSDSDADAYKNALLRGCRCVEIDVWDGDDSDSESDTSDSDGSSGSDKSGEKKVAKELSRRQRIASKFPRSLASRLEKTSLVSKSATEKEEKVTGQVPKQNEQNVADGVVLSKTPSPRAVAVEPRVLHGYTLTKDISFRDVCEAIRDYAFVVSDLPVIASLEVHCNSQQQEMMVQIMNETWAEFLLPKPTEDAQYLPSPDKLRRKILVKVKYAPPGISPPVADVEEVDDKLPQDPQADPKAKAKKPSKITQALSALGIYTRGVSFKSLTQPEASMPSHVFSLSEGTVEEVHDKSAQLLFEHNRRYMMRAYPSGMRFQSSNLDPPVFWRKGIQIVALNWQKWDEGMMMNEGMFAGTGGYVLKPDGYRGNKHASGPGSNSTEAAAISMPAPTPAILHHVLDLKITVFAAQNLPLPHKDDKVSGFKPYVKVELHTEPPHTLLRSKHEDARAKEGEYKAHTHTQKGVHPDFKGEVLAFERVAGVVPGLAFVRFLVKDDEIGHDDLAAWACIRLDRLRPGYRFVHLLNAKGMVSSGVLLVKVEKTLS
ncbi:putative phospholipase c [Rosellinia necatrix]|uniref:Phosphoinositide phospholipase C n=1 Tax=Rosellinia necatrix TaxID=77044 RepID=A0A1W2TJP7_ROSNE|nr:putative phospholipase c [Rosellinia necatrix]